MGSANTLVLLALLVVATVALTYRGPRSYLNSLTFADLESSDTQCSDITMCANCTATGVCSWCGDTNSCHNSTSIQCNCLHTDSATCVECSTFTDCGSCSGSCAWCASSGTCEEISPATSNAPAELCSGSCMGGMSCVGSCPNTECQYSRCTGCVAAGSTCSWCSDTQMCLLSNSTGYVCDQSNGTCSNVIFPQGACAVCSAGYFSVDGFEPCLPCPYGNVSLGNQSTTCGDCPSNGTYPVNANSCQDCPANTYAAGPIADISGCLPCPNDQTSWPGAASCYPCPAGQVQVPLGGCAPPQAISTTGASGSPSGVISGNKRTIYIVVGAVIVAVVIVAVGLAFRAYRKRQDDDEHKPLTHGMYMPAEGRGGLNFRNSVSKY